MIRSDVVSRSVKRVERSKKPSEIWKIANEISKPQTREDIVLHDEKGEMIKDAHEISKSFNEFFIGKIDKLKTKIDERPKVDPLGKLREKMSKKRLNFKLKLVKEKQILKIVKSLKNTNSSGVDSITTKIIKDSIGVLITPITRIVNTSILTGTFPEDWKLAKVIPILKKGDSKEKSNYRPISILPVTSKILEETVRQQVSRYFEKNNLFPKHQHGFRPKWSTRGLTSDQTYIGPRLK